ncbi:MAG: hypothetical protein AMK72_04750 [Planctomycetes bacterium SM23_25]|nr:MAG: hypothetical protein AMK72_04750 [Planctomycetes bacterium SM23_25]
MRPMTTRRHVHPRAVLAITAAILVAGAAAARAATSGDVLWKHYIVRSSAAGKIERFWVGHAKGLKADGAYPAIYFLDGLLGDEHEWKNALDPLLGRYDVVAVCPSVGGATWFMNSPAQPWMRWGDFLTEELRGFVESKYPVSREKGQRGIVGISAGGHAAFYHAIQRPYLYGSVSVLSGAMELRGYAGIVGLDHWIGPRGGETFRLYSEHSCIVLAAKQEPPLPFALSLDAGAKDGALGQMEALRRILDSRGLAYQWHVGQGAHDWTYWKSRAGAHLAWHAEQFARNRSESRHTDKAPPGAVDFEILKSYPDVTLSDEALRRLRAPWGEAANLRPIKTGGLPQEGAPLSQTDPKYKEATFGADLTTRGHGPALDVYRLTLAASTPLPKAGTIGMTGDVRNGRRMRILRTSPIPLPVPAGEPQRRVELRCRIAVELREPDALRGGIVVGVQVFGADGLPAGDPVLGTSKPGTTSIERWPLAPQAKSLWTLTLSGDDALPLAAIHEARMEVE